MGKFGKGNFGVEYRMDSEICRPVATSRELTIKLGKTNFNAVGI
jgi:hypothetical protein